MRKIFIVLLVLSLAAYAYSAPQGVPKHITFKGLNTRGGPLSLDDGESPDCLNVHTNIYGTLIKRMGYSKLSATGHAHVSTSPGIINGLYDYAVNSSTSKLMAFVDGNLYKMDNLDGTLDPVDGVFSDNIAEFENFDGTLIITTWSRDTGHSWNGTSGNTTLISQMPTGKHIIKAYNRVFLQNIIDGTDLYELRFYWSNAGSYTTWTVASDYETLDAGAGDVGMGWGLLKGRLFGFTKYTVSLISDVGGASPIEVKKRLDGVGCGAPRSIKTVNHSSMGESLVWITQDKRLVIYNGSNLTDISEKIYTYNGVCPFYMTAISAANLYKAYAQVYEKQGWYVLWVPVSTNIDYCIVYDYKSGTLWPFSAQNFNSSALVSTTSGNLVYVGERDGEIHRWYHSNADNGSSISGYWTSRRWDFGFAPFLKKMGENQIALKGIGNYDLNYYTRYNWSGNWSAAEAMNMRASDWVLGENLPAILGGRLANSHRITIPSAYNLMQIKLATNNDDPAWEVYSMDLITNVISSVGD